MHALVTTAGRQATRRRSTREISLEVAVDLDRSEPIVVSTDIGFLNRLIEQLAREGGFALRLLCEGGPRADARLVIEDCAIELGAALRVAARNALSRTSHELTVCVEEAQATVSIDANGQPGAAVDGDFGCRQIGGLPTELVPEFFHSIGHSLGRRLCIRARGEVETHMIAACFRGLGLALLLAIRN